MILQTPLSVSSSPSEVTSHPLDIWQTFHHMAEQLDISQKYCICQPGYRDYKLSTEMMERLQSLPEDVQERSWVFQLRSYLYGTFYNGSLKTALAEVDQDAPVLSVENDSFMGVDLQFYQQLHDSNSGQGYFEPGWQVIELLEENTFKVKKGELTLRIDRDRHLPTQINQPTVGDEVAIRMPKNLVQNGFYMAVGDAGSDRPYHEKRPETLVRIYFNLTIEGAIAVMTQLTTDLNQQQIPFSFKALYNPGDYGRHDSAVLYFSKSDFERVRPVLQDIYQGHADKFGTDIPLFTKLLAPGLGCAEETDFKFGSQESFGLNRCHIVALGLIAGQALDSTAAKRDEILQAFTNHDLDWQRPYLNAGSADIYEPLSL